LRPSRCKKALPSADDRPGRTTGETIHSSSAPGGNQSETRSILSHNFAHSPRLRAVTFAANFSSIPLRRFDWGRFDWGQPELQIPLRPSSRKGAHAALSSAAWQEIRVRFGRDDKGRGSAFSGEWLVAEGERRSSADKKGKRRFSLTRWNGFPASRRGMRIVPLSHKFHIASSRGCDSDATRVV
jgi:hypothetical protein